jgi:hypothetical protein
MDKLANSRVDYEETLSTEVKKYRVQLDFNPKDFKVITDLVEELGLATRAELFRSALVALRWMVQKKKADCTIVAITPADKLIEPEFEFLQNVSQPAQRVLTATVTH